MHPCHPCYPWSKRVLVYRKERMEYIDRPLTERHGDRGAHGAVAGGNPLMPTDRHHYSRLGRRSADVRPPWRRPPCLALDRWVLRRVRQCYWKMWKRARCRRRNLLRLGADPEQVHLCSRSRKGCWRMSTNSIIQAALNNEWLKKQGVVSLQESWTAYHYPGGAPRVDE